MTPSAVQNFWVVRAAGVKDAPALSTLGQATFYESFVDSVPSTDLVSHCRHQHGESYYRTALNAPDMDVFLAALASNDAPIGYVLLTAPSIDEVETRPGDVELKRLYVLARYHKARVGAGLMNAALNTAKAQNARRMILGVYGQNHQAISFYRRFGFEHAGTRRFRVGDQVYDDWVMTLDLTR